MSKISKALDKALEERGGFTNLPEVTKASQPPQPAATPVIPVYSQTAVCQVLDTRQLNLGRIIGGNQGPQFHDAINVLRTQVLQRTRPKGWNTIMVTSPTAGAGKTTVAINLAVSLAQDINQTALLVDLNLRNPKIAERLCMGERPGLVEHLTEDIPIGDLLVNPGIEKLVVLPAGKNPKRSLELLGAPRMKQLVSELKNRYPDRYVIFDVPHVVDVADPLVCAEYVDAIIMVVSDSETGKDALNSALELLQERNIIGVVLNKTR